MNHNKTIKIKIPIKKIRNLLFEYAFKRKAGSHRKSNKEKRPDWKRNYDNYTVL